MAKVDLKRTVYEKNQFNRVIGNRDFTTFVQAVEDTTPTVEDFFNLYDQLYLTIPINGINQSHEYLIRKSTELVGIQDTTEDIQPLLDEIANLRQQLLEARQEILLEQIKSSNAGSEVNNNLINLLDRLNQQEVQPVVPDTPPTPTVNTPLPLETTEETTVVPDLEIQFDYTLTFEPTSENTYLPQTVNVLEGYDESVELDSITPTNKGTTVVDKENGSITYTPEVGDFGTFVTGYKLKNSKGQVVQGFINLIVVKIESNVSAGDDFMYITYIKNIGQYYDAALQILENDSGKNLRFDQFLSYPNSEYCLGVTCIGGVFRYELNKNYNFPLGKVQDTVKYQVVDEFGTTSQATIHITIDTKTFNIIY